MSNESGPPSDVPTPLRKGKKKVGFQASRSEDDSPNAAAGSELLSPFGTPKLPSGVTPPGAPDARELRIALTKVLWDERLDLDQVGRSEVDQPEQPPTESLQAKQSEFEPEPSRLEIPGPKVPRPALRRNTSYDAPEEREEADRMEQAASQRQLQSMTDARKRAHRLAKSVGSYSAPGSRRNSFDQESTFQSAMDDSDDHDDTPGVQKATNSLKPRGEAGVPSEGQHHHLRHRNGYRSEPKPLTPPLDDKDDHLIAESLVRSHIAKARKHSLHHEAHGSMSGTTTPVLHQAYAHDYVPRPTKYRGGILASLLKLYNDDRGGSSGNTTPSNPATPVMSPRPSPPTSRPTSTIGSPRSFGSPRSIGSPRSRPSSGLFNYHRSHHSTSSLALTELIKSSSMFAVPGSSEIHDQWSEKIKKEEPLKPKKEKERIRITVHIAGIISRHRYLIKLCRALMLYGAPTHRLEEYMQMSARVLEIEGQFLYMPSCMIISFDDSTTHTTEVKVVRVRQGIDLGKLREVHNIYKDVVHDKVGVEDATRRLEAVMDKKKKFSTFFCVIVYGIASACVAPFAFQGRFIDLPVCFLLGCIVGVLQLVFAPSNELYAHVFEVTASIITSFIARGFGSILGGDVFCFGALAQSSIALILPGYMVLCSSLELQSHNLVSGSVRMVHAMIYTLFLGYGITIGASLYGMMDRNASSVTRCAEPLGREWYFFFVPAFTLCLCIVNQAQWKQTPVMIVMSLAGFCVNSYCGTFFEGNTQISNMLGALTIGILANLYSRLGRHFENAWLDAVEWWEYKVKPRLSRRKRRTDSWPLPPLGDPESGPPSPDEKPPQRAPRQVGYSLAAAAMLPAIFVQVPSGLAAGGSLLAGVNSANQITGNSTVVTTGNAALPNFDTTAFGVLLSVVQVAIGISVGLFMSALIVYPLGKRNSGLFSF